MPRARLLPPVPGARRFAALLALAAPLAGPTPAHAALVPSTSRLVFNTVVGTGASPARSFAVTNTTAAPVTVTAVQPAGAAFHVTATSRTLPATLEPGAALIVGVSFTPAGLGPVTSTLQVSAGALSAQIALGAIGTRGLYSANEPSLQWILDASGVGLVAGDRNAATAAFRPTAFPVGSEIVAPTFVAAGGTPTVQVLAVFSKGTKRGWTTRLGLYEAGNPANATAPVLSVGQPDQALDPLRTMDAQTLISPPAGVTRFGFYSRWEHFFSHTATSEDAFNTWDATNRHKVRVYPLADATGLPVPHAYVLATEEYTQTYDWNDLVVVLRNVQPG